MFQSKSKITAFLISTAILSFAFGYFIFAWTEPGNLPPDGNVSPPINVGSIEQVKSGKLGIVTSGIDPGYGLTVGDSSNLLGIKSSGNSYFERDLRIGNFRFYPISATELGIKNEVGDLILILD